MTVSVVFDEGQRCWLLLLDGVELFAAGSKAEVEAVAERYRQATDERGAAMPGKVHLTESGKSRVTGADLTLVVEDDYYAGHGLTGNYRWSVYYENEYRPRLGYRHGVAKLDVAIRQGRQFMAMHDC